MDDLKLYAKNVKELDSLGQTVWVISDDIGMEFGIQKCTLGEYHSIEKRTNGREQVY
jgi:hypothetical protein